MSSTSTAQGKPPGYRKNCEVCKRGKFGLNPVDKLFVCRACNSTWYCSKECQRKHWPVHKAVCEQCRTRLPHVEDLERRILAAAPHISEGIRDTLRNPLPTEFKAEVEAFLTKFKGQLMEAGWCALNLRRDCTAWERKVLYLHLERIPDPSPSSRPWSRFRIKDAEAVLVSDLQLMPGQFMDGLRNWIPYKEQLDTVYRRASGYTGMLSIVAQCPYDTNTGAIHPTNHSTHIGYGPGPVRFPERGNWVQNLKKAVERMAGRATIEAVDA